MQLQSLSKTKEARGFGNSNQELRNSAKQCHTRQQIGRYDMDHGYFLSGSGPRANSPPTHVCVSGVCIAMPRDLVGPARCGVPASPLGKKALGRIVRRG